MKALTIRSRSLALSVAATTVLLTAACSDQPDEPFPSGGPVTSDQAQQTFAKLMHRPDIEQASQQYEQMGSEVQQSLSKAIPALSDWRREGELSGTTCDGNSYPSLGFDGQTRTLPRITAAHKLTDDEYEKALTIVGGAVSKFGFNKNAQRLHDSPGAHYAAFHNVTDDGRILFNSDQGTVMTIQVGCYLTAAAKKRGHPSDS